MRQFIGLKIDRGEQSGRHRSPQPTSVGPPAGAVFLQGLTRYSMDMGDLKQAWDYSQQWAKSAEAEGEGREMGRAYTWQANIQCELSDCRQALKYYQMAERTEMDSLELAGLWQDQDLIYSYISQFSKAEGLLTRAERIFRSHGDHEKTGCLVNDLGVCYEQQRKYQEARRCFEEAMFHFQKIGYQLGSATAAGNLAKVCIHLGELDRFSELAELCCHLGREIEDVLTCGLGHEILAEIHLLLKDPQTAQNHLVGAEECAQRAQDYVFCLNIIIKKIRAFVLMGRHEEVGPLWDRAQEILTDRDDPIVGRRLEYWRAWAAAGRAEHRQALEIFDRLLSGKVEIAGEVDTISLLRGKAGNLAAQGLLGQAREVFEKIEWEDNNTWPSLLDHCSLRVKIYDGLNEYAISENYRRKAEELLQALWDKNPCVRHRLRSLFSSRGL